MNKEKKMTKFHHAGKMACSYPNRILLEQLLEAKNFADP
jgi:hypothetical protein